MEPIICKNEDIGSLVKRLQDFLKGGRTIKSICLVDHSGSQTILLVDDKDIDKKAAEIWWSGYSAGMQAALQ